MKKSQNVTVATRAYDYASDGMYVFDKQTKIMHCKFCNCRVDWERKSVVDNHIKSTGHKAAKEKYKTNNKRQASVGDSFERAKKVKEDREDFIKNVVHAFVEANIPIHKLDNKAIRKLFNKYIPGGGDLPCAKTLRDKYVPLLKKEFDEKLKAKLKGRKIAVLCDETTNRKGEATFVTLFKVLPSEGETECFLMVASVKVLSAANADQTSKAIIQTLDYFAVEHENVLAVASDSAAYMNLCVKLLQQLVNPNIVHIQCWAHKMDKVGKVFQDKLQRLNECVSNTKKLFKNTRKRKHKYIKFLKDKYSFNNAKEAKLFPMPNMTRWDSWRTSVQYMSEYVEDIYSYAKELPETDSPKSVKYFKKLSQEDIKIIKAEAVFVVEYCTPVCDLIEYLEGSHYPMAHSLYSKVNEVKNVFSVLKSASDIMTALYSKTKASLSELSSHKKNNLIDRIKGTATKCCEIITDFLSKDTGKSFFESTQILFDPCKIIGGANEKDIEKAKNNLHLFNPIPLADFKVLHSLFSDLVKEKLKNGDSASASTKKKKGQYTDVVSDMLLTMKQKYPKFVALCLIAINIPVSNVDSERAFSAYNDILSSKRTRLSAENTEVMLCLYFSDEIDDDFLGESSDGNSQNAGLNPIENFDDDDPDGDLMEI